MLCLPNDPDGPETGKNCQKLPKTTKNGLFFKCTIVRLIYSPKRIGRSKRNISMFSEATHLPKTLLSCTPQRQFSGDFQRFDPPGYPLIWRGCVVLAESVTRTFNCPIHFIANKKFRAPRIRHLDIGHMLFLRPQILANFEAWAILFSQPKPGHFQMNPFAGDSTTRSNRIVT